MATMVYANRVPMDIMSISCCRSKMVAIIPAKTTKWFHFIHQNILSLLCIYIQQLRYNFHWPNDINIQIV